jgi:hypothetical protein
MAGGEFLSLEKLLTGLWTSPKLVVEVLQPPPLSTLKRLAEGSTEGPLRILGIVLAMNRSGKEQAALALRATPI